MSRIHYFQRYSSVENTVTNNTLLLFARIYEHSPAAASTLLSDLTGEAIHIGIEVAQQQRAKKSVPDGAIIQRSFKVVIETKVDASADAEQLLRHAEAFAHESQKVLLFLTKQPELSVTREVNEKLRETHPDVVFRNITYEELCRSARLLFREHEGGMLTLVDDYLEYCNDAKLFNQAKFLMRVVPCSASIAINKRFGIYFHSADRGYTAHRFIGIYAEKSVRAVLEIGAVFDVALTNGKLKKTLVEGVESHKYDDALRKIIAAAKTECGYEIESGHRFFCGELADTDFRKTSLHGIQGPRLLNLVDFIGEPGTLESVAHKLQGKNWQ